MSVYRIAAGRIIEVEENNRRAVSAHTAIVISTFGQLDTSGRKDETSALDARLHPGREAPLNNLIREVPPSPRNGADF